MSPSSTSTCHTHGHIGPAPFPHCLLPHSSTDSHFTTWFTYFSHRYPALWHMLPPAAETPFPELVPWPLALWSAFGHFSKSYFFLSRGLSKVRPFIESQGVGRDVWIRSGPNPWQADFKVRAGYSGPLCSWDKFLTKILGASPRMGIWELLWTERKYFSFNPVIVSLTMVSPPCSFFSLD